MHTLFAFQFDIQPAEGQIGFACLTAVRDELEHWVRDLYHQFKRELPPLPFDGSVANPHPHHDVRTDHLTCASHSLATLEWEFPEPGDGIASRFTCVLGCDEQMVQMAMRIDIVSRTPVLREMPFQIHLGSNPLFCYPTLLAKLVNGWTCRMAGWPLRSQFRVLRANLLDQFVRDLVDPERALPIFLVNRPRLAKLGDATLQQLSGKLLGLADLAALPNATANARLTALLGPERSCDKGVLRIYWPGFTADANPAAHPLFAAENLRNVLEKEPLELWLVRTMSAISVARFREGPLIGAARAALARDQAGWKAVETAAVARIADAEAARQKAEETGAAHRVAAEAVLRKTKEQCATLRRENDAARQQSQAVEALLVQARDRIAELEEELRKASETEMSVALEQAWDENKALKDLHEQEHRRANELDAELDRLKANWAQVWVHPVEPAPEQCSEQVVAVNWEFDSVADALVIAEVEFGDVLTVWTDARRSAQQSPFSSPGKVYRALKAIAEVGRDYFRSHETGVTLGPVEQAFASRVPFKYTGFESKMTMNRFGDERIFHHHNQSRQMQRHLTLGGGTTNNCLQIYFDFDDANRRVLIGYCGKHLQYYRQRT